MPGENIARGSIHTGGWRYREGENDFGDIPERPELILTVTNVLFLCNRGCAGKCFLKIHINPV